MIDGSIPWPGDVADDGRDPMLTDAEHVVEVAGHEAGTRLVDPPEFEPGELGEFVGGQALSPGTRREFVLREHLFGATLDLRPLLGEPRLVDEVLPEDDRDHHRHQHEREEDVGLRRTGHRRRRGGDGQNRVEGAWHGLPCGTTIARARSRRSQRRTHPPRAATPVAAGAPTGPRRRRRRRTRPTTRASRGVSMCGAKNSAE